MTSLAALALYDGGAEITASNINVLLSGSDNKVQPYWPGLFASLLSNRINELIYSVGGGGGGGSSAAASASSAPAGDGKLLEYSIDHIESLRYCMLVLHVMNRANTIHFAAMIMNIHTSLSNSSSSLLLSILECICQSSRRHLIIIQLLLLIMSS